MKKKSIIITVIVTVVLTVCTFGYTVVYGDWLNEETSSLSAYGKWDGLLGKTNLFIFPESIQEYDENAEYYYYNNSSSIGPSSCVFLKCTYSAEDYEKELSRLKAIESVKFNEDNYSYDAFVTIDAKSEDEYALLCGDNTIVYVFAKEGFKPGKPLENKYTKKNDPASGEDFTIYDYDNHDDFIYWPDSWKF